MKLSVTIEGFGLTWPRWKEFIFLAEAAGYSAVYKMEAMENATKPLQAVEKSRGLGVLGHWAGRLQSGAVAYRQISRTDARARQGLLAQSWPCQFPTAVHPASYLTEPPDADPHVRWCGGIAPLSRFQGQVWSGVTNSTAAM